MAQKQCYGQQFRLRPDADVVQVILYTLAYTANKYDIELHDFVVMSNHDHIVSTDPEGARGNPDPGSRWPQTAPEGGEAVQRTEAVADL